jgi:hypothetical protein
VSATGRATAIVTLAAAAAALLAFSAPLVAIAAPETPPASSITGTVFDDTNKNGRHDTGETGLPGIAVSNQIDVVTTDKEGRYTLPPPAGGRVVFVSLPDGWSPSGSFWHPAAESAAAGASPAGAGLAVDFGLVRRPASTTFTFLHASDSHLDAASLPHLRRLQEIVAAQRPAFVLLTGDLVRDSLRVGEDTARPLFEMVQAELKRFAVPVFTVPGNHDIFGIERNLSHVAADHPLYGRAMYRHFFGPDYYSFTWGGVRFCGLNSVDNDDMSYYGHVDADQIGWLARDVAAAPAKAPLVTFNHIPFATSVEGLLGLMEDSPAPSVIQIAGHGQFRHVVSNLSDVLGAIGKHRLEIALGGHMHVSERLSFDTTAGHVRFHQTAALVGQSDAAGLTFVSGATLYKVRDGRVDDGTFLPLDVQATTVH